MEVSKVDFFSFFQKFPDKVFNNERIAKGAFRKTGLIPLNPMKVLEKMKEYQKFQKELRPMTPPPRESSPVLLSSSRAFTTPHSLSTNWHEYSTHLTLRSRERGIDYIRERMNDAMGGVPLTPSVMRLQDKVEKASMTSIHAAAFSTNRIHDLSIAEAARKKRKESSGGNKVVQKYG
jgi:hypothetical protein